MQTVTVPVTGLMASAISWTQMAMVSAITVLMELEQLPPESILWMLTMTGFVITILPKRPFEMAQAVAGAKAGEAAEDKNGALGCAARERQKEL